MGETLAVLEKEFVVTESDAAIKFECPHCRGTFVVIKKSPELYARLMSVAEHHPCSARKE